MSDSTSPTNGFQSSSSMQGTAFENHVARTLIAEGYTIVYRAWTHPEAKVEIDFVVTRQGLEDVWFVEAKGSWLSDRNGLERTDTLKKAIASAFIIGAVDPSPKFVIAASHLPKAGSAGDTWLRIAIDRGVIDAVWLAPMAFAQHGAPSPQLRFEVAS